MRHGSEAACVRGEARAPAAVAAHDHSVDVLRVGVDPLAADEARTLRRREPEEPEPQDDEREAASPRASTTEM